MLLYSAVNQALDTILVSFCLPVLIVVGLPSMIVWLVVRARSHELDKKTEVILAAIEKGQKIDADYFSKEKRGMTLKEKIYKKLRVGVVLTAFGIASCVAALVSNLCSLGFPPMEVTVLPAIVAAVGIAYIINFRLNLKAFSYELEMERRMLEKEVEGHGKSEDAAWE